MKILFLLLLLTMPAFAQVFSIPAEPVTGPAAVEPVAPVTTAAPVCPPCPKPKEEVTSATLRDDSFGTVLAGFQFVNTWVPAKLTGSYTQIFNKDFSLEFEYATSKRETEIAGYQLGTLREERYTLMLKYYVGTSFHLSLGPYISELSFKLDDKITDVLGNRINDEAKISLIGVTFGIGNRWQYKNGITFGIDWMRLNQPTGTYKVNERIFKNLDDNDEDAAKRTGKLFKTIPAFTFFGVNLGYTF